MFLTRFSCIPQTLCSLCSFGMCLLLFDLSLLLQFLDLIFFFLSNSMTFTILRFPYCGWLALTDSIITQPTKRYALIQPHLIPATKFSLTTVTHISTANRTISNQSLFRIRF